MNSLGRASPLPGEPAQTPDVVAWYSEGFRDRLGDRLLLFDNVGTGLELLRLDPELAGAEGFEAALRARVEQLKDFRHPAFSRVRAVKWLDDPSRQLAIVSEHVSGERLSRVLQLARTRGLRPGPDAAVWLIRQLLPGLAALHDHSGHAHGLLTADSVIVRPGGELAVADHALSAALDGRFAPSELWHRFGVTLPAGVIGGASDARADVQQVARLALVMLTGHARSTDDPPESAAELLERAREPLAAGGERLRAWLTRALAIGEAPFESAAEAHQALESLPRSGGAWAEYLLPRAAGERRGADASAPLPAPMSSPSIAAAHASLAELAKEVRASLATRIRSSLAAEAQPPTTPALPASLLLYPSENEAPRTRASVHAVTKENAIVRRLQAKAAARSAPAQMQRLRILSGGLAAVALVEAALLIATRSPAAPTQGSAAATMSVVAGGGTAVSPPRREDSPAPGAGTSAATNPTDAPARQDRPPAVIPPKTAPAVAPARQAPAVVDGAARGTSGESRAGAPAAARAPASGARAVQPAPRGVIGWLAVRSDIDVRVYANGRLLGSGPGGTFRLPEGNHDITLVNESAGLRTMRSVRIVPGQTVSIAPDTPER